MWLAATLLDSTGSEQSRGLFRRRAVLSQATHGPGVAAPAGTGRDRGAWLAGVKGPRLMASQSRDQKRRFEVVKNSCLFPSAVSETQPYSLVYIINLLCETCFIN